MTIQNIKLNKILPNPFQTRTSEDPAHVQNLAQSIKQEGLLQVPLGRWALSIIDQPGMVELAFGHSRLAAFKLLADDYDGYADEMPVTIMPLSDEEMFTRAVTENNSRKDLSPIEIARAMITYRDQFGKTSKEIGELFHLSSSAVRNKIRLLELPETAQAKIDQGEITEGSARSLLQLQRINPKKLEAVIEKASEEQSTTVELDRVVTDAITDGQDIQLMHERWQAGEPRAGKNLWLLSEWVPPLVAGQQDYFDDIRPMLKKVVAFTYLSFGEFAAMQNMLVEDEAAWETRYGNYSPRELEIFQVMAVMTPCTQCPLHVVKNGHHYCGFKPCWAWRKKKYRAEILAAKSEEMGVPVYERSDGKSDRLEKYDTWNRQKYFPKIEELFEKWLAEKAECLRLKFSTDRYRKNKFTEDHSVALICVGEAALQAIQDIVEAEEEEADDGLSKWEINGLKQDASNKFIDQVAAPVFSQVFNDLPTGFFQWIMGYSEITDATVRDFTRWIITNPVEYSDMIEGPTYIAEMYQELAEIVNLDLPKDWMEKAAEYEPEIEEKGKI